MPAWGPLGSPSLPPSLSWAPQTQKSPLSRSRLHPRPIVYLNIRLSTRNVSSLHRSCPQSHPVRGCCPVTSSPPPAPWWTQCRHHPDNNRVYHLVNISQGPCQTFWRSPCNSRSPRLRSWPSISPLESSGPSRSCSRDISCTQCSDNNK